jgi:hypothetical protein
MTGNSIKRWTKPGETLFPRPQLAPVAIVCDYQQRRETYTRRYK